MTKYVYLFKEGNASMRNLLGGKGANLAEMTKIGLPVPQGFTVTTEACTRYYEDGKPCIAFELNDEGAKIFAEATAANLGKTISITLDGETISRATVNTVIAGGKGEITGNFTADEAKNLATLILSGALPLNLTQLEVSAMMPSTMPSIVSPRKWRI